jgi:hypothetical protein
MKKFALLMAVVLALLASGYWLSSLAHSDRVGSDGGQWRDSDPWIP